ncbi:MAG TPA: hypothetical protein G4O12_06115 [Dehalococcoidia bacterium]|nr:hypothetical protein [Dehalococcoidia bacterium]
MKDADRSYSQLKKEQLGRESELLSQLLGSVSELKDLATFEADLGLRRNEILFKVTVEIEDTRNALKQAEQLVDRLKKHLSQLEGLHRILTKK